MNFGLDENVIKKIHRVFVAYPQISKVVIYGSRAMGNYENGSDIDLTFDGSGLTLEIINKIDIDLDDLLLPYSFDLSIYSHIENTDLIAHIERNGKVFYPE